MTQLCWAAAARRRTARGGGDERSRKTMLTGRLSWQSWPPSCQARPATCWPAQISEPDHRGHQMACLASPCILRLLGCHDRACMASLCRVSGARVLLAPPVHAAQQLTGAPCPRLLPLPAQAHAPPPQAPALNLSWLLQLRPSLAWSPSRRRAQAPRPRRSPPLRRPWPAATPSTRPCWPRPRRSPSGRPPPSRPCR